jgi:hypothetical protein
MRVFITLLFLLGSFSSMAQVLDCEFTNRNVSLGFNPSYEVIRYNPETNYFRLEYSYIDQHGADFYDQGEELIRGYLSLEGQWHSKLNSNIKVEIKNIGDNPSIYRLTYSNPYHFTGVVNEQIICR